MLRTLIVDDNVSFRHSFREHLCQYSPGMNVVEAGSVSDALVKFAETSPDMVFIDIDIAGESGLELTRKIREHHADMPIAILTNHDLPEYREAAQESGANYFFSKGASSMEEVLILVDTIVFERQRRGEVEIP
jgi:two-component system OmpR family response regulator